MARGRAGSLVPFLIPFGQRARGRLPVAGQLRSGRSPLSPCGPWDRRSCGPGHLPGWAPSPILGGRCHDGTPVPPALGQATADVEALTSGTPVVARPRSPSAGRGFCPVGPLTVDLTGTTPIHAFEPRASGTMRTLIAATVAAATTLGTGTGFGDTRLTGLFGVLRDGPFQAPLHAGVSIPTGSIDQMDVTPASAPNEAQLPYPMQLGSGTWDLLPDITILSMTERGSWGIQGTGEIRLRENDREYTLRNSYEGTAWLAYRATERISLSTRVVAATWGDIEGADPTFVNPMMVPPHGPPQGDPPRSVRP